MENKTFEHKLEQIRAHEGEYFEVNEAGIAKYLKHRFKNQSSISIKILSVFGGILAALFFAGFIAVLDLFENESGLLLFGTIFIGGAIAINMVHTSFFIGNLSISAFILGVIMIGWGLATMELFAFIKIVYILIALLSIVLVASYFLNFLSTILFLGALTAFFVSGDFLYFDLTIQLAGVAIVFTLWLLFEAKWITLHTKIAKRYNAIRDGLFFCLLFGITYPSMSSWLIGSSHSSTFGSFIVTSFVFIAAILFVCYLIINKLEIKDIKSISLIFAFSLLFLALLAPAPSILGSLLILLLGFYTRYYAGVALGIVGLLVFFVKFYYDLSITLLNKSLILMAAGTLFIGFYFLTKKFLNSYEKV